MFATSPLNLVLTSITSFLILGLGIIVFLKNKNSWTNRSFGIFSLGVAIWVFSAYLSDLPSFFYFSLYLNRLIFAGLSLAFSGLCHFCFIFPRKKEPPNFFLIFIYATGAILSFLSLFTPFIIKEITFEEWGTDLVEGPLFPLFIGFSLIGIIGLAEIFREYKRASSLQKAKLQYLFLGLSLFVFFNIFIHIILPAIRGSREFYQIGNYSTIFLIGFTAYAIVAEQLFDIRVILSEVLVGVIALILFIQMLVAEAFWIKILNGGIFVLFCIFGYFLIRSVFKEIEFREKLEKAYKELEKLDVAKSEFIAMASHQLRTPLTIIKGLVSMILEGTYNHVTGKLKRPMKSIFNSNERLIRIVNDLLSISKIELGKMELEKKEFQVEDLIDSVYKEMEFQTKKKNLDFIWERPKISLPKLKGDESKIRQVVFNLVDNAIRYTKEGKVEIKTKKEDSKIRISVSDTGLGLSKEERERLFEAFVRGEAGISQWIQGVGLGLYLSKKYIELHKGKIWAESPGKGKGSTFYIELPIR